MCWIIGLCLSFHSHSFAYVHLTRPLCRQMEDVIVPHPDAAVQLPMWCWSRHVKRCLDVYFAIPWIMDWICEYAGSETHIVPRQQEYRSVLILSVATWWQTLNLPDWKMWRPGHMVDRTIMRFPPRYLASWGRLTLEFPLWWYDDPNERYEYCGSYPPYRHIVDHHEECHRCRDGRWMPPVWVDVSIDAIVMIDGMVLAEVLAETKCTFRKGFIH